jgi:hypothetical protein
MMVKTTLPDQDSETSPMVETLVDSGVLVDPLIVDLPTGATALMPEAETIVLELGDLLPDASGDVVLFASEEVPVNIVADQALTESGIAPEHVTATGVDVTGLLFYSFESGVTLYSHSSLLITEDTGAG